MAQSPSVLVMFSEASEQPFTQALSANFKQEIAQKFPNATVHFEYFDLFNTHPKNYDLLREYMYNKYADVSLDAIFYSGDKAFALMHENSAFRQDIPQFLVSFSKTTYSSQSVFQPYVLPIKRDYKRLVLEALQLSKADKVFILVKTNTSSYLTDVELIKNELSSLKANDKIEFVEFTTTSDVLAYINAQEVNSAVIITPFNIMLDNKPLPIKQSVELLASQLNLPVFVHWDALLNQHVLGGYMVSSELIAKQVVLAIDYIVNKKVPFFNQENIYSRVYNRPLLDKFDINLHNLPANAAVINSQANPIDIFFTEIVLGSIVIGILGMTSIAMFSWNRTLKRQQTRLYESDIAFIHANERLEVATNAAELGVWEYYIEDDSLYWNKWMFNLHNLKPDNFSPTLKSWLSIVDSLYSGDLSTAFLLSINKGASLTQEYEFVLNNQQSRFLRIHAEVLTNFDNEPVRLIGTLQDISQQKHFELAIESEQQKAKSALHSKSQFIANIGHEIRTPMNAIIGSASLLNKTDLTAQQKNQTDLIVSSAKSLMFVVNDILDLSRIESGRLQIDKYDFDLQELLQQTILSFQQECKNKGLRLELNLQDALPKVVNSDGLRIKQVLYNLIANAIKFTQFGFVKLGVEFDINENQSKGLLRFVVSDSGIGISKDAQRILFKKFEQKNTQDIKKYAGSGLSLHISHNIATLMNGSITLESERRKGSQFTFTLPVGLPATEKFEKLVTGPDVVPNLQNKQVLVADDVESNRMIISYMLAETGATIVFAEDGIQAYETCKKHEIHLIIMDILMPKMDGIVATKSLREYERKHNKSPLPIVALTAQEMPGDRELCYEIGMNAYLPKPITRFELFSEINKLI